MDEKELSENLELGYKMQIKKVIPELDKLRKELTNVENNEVNFSFDFIFTKKVFIIIYREVVLQMEIPNSKVLYQYFWRFYIYVK